VGVKRSLVSGVIDGKPVPREGMEYRIVYIGVRNSVWWDSLRGEYMVVQNSVTKMIMRLGIQLQRAEHGAVDGGATRTTEAVHFRDLAGDRTVQYAYICRQSMCDREVLVALGDGWWTLGPRRRVVLCHGAWVDTDPPDRDFSLMAREMHKVQQTGGHWDERRMLNVRRKMGGRRMIAVGVCARLIGDELRGGQTGDHRPGERHSGEMIRYRPRSHSELGDEEKGTQRTPRDRRWRRRGSGGSDRSDAAEADRGHTANLPPRVGGIPPRK